MTDLETKLAAKQPMKVNSVKVNSKRKAKKIITGKTKQSKQADKAHRAAQRVR